MIAGKKYTLMISRLSLEQIEEGRVGEIDDCEQTPLFPYICPLIFNGSIAAGRCQNHFNSLN